MSLFTVKGKKKRYCSQCKFYENVKSKRVCGKHFVYKDTYAERIEMPSKKKEHLPKIKNKNNDCIDYRDIFTGGDGW
jgi:hypothetical protein